MTAGADQRRVTAFLVLAPLLWGGNFVVGSAMAAELQGVWMNFLRWVIALAVLTPFCLPSVWQYRAVLMRHLGRLAIMGLLGVTLFNTVLYAGLESASVSVAAVAFAVTPFLITGLLALIRRERPRPRLMVAATIALFGMLLAQWGSLQLGTPVKGIAFVLLAAVFWSGYCVALKHFEIPAPARAVFYAQILMGLVFMLPMIVVTDTPDLLALGAPELAGLGYLGVFAAAIAFWVWQRAISRAGPARAGLFMNLVPVSSIVFGAIFLGTHISQIELLAFAFVFYGIYLSSTGDAHTKRIPSSVDQILVPTTAQALTR